MEYQHTTNVNIHHVLCDPYLVSFPFYTIPICLFLKIHRIFQINRESDRIDPDTILYTLEKSLNLLDDASEYQPSEKSLRGVGQQLVSLFEHWAVLQCHLSPCTALAVGLNANCSSSAGHKGRPPVFVNPSMVEYLQHNGYTWDEIGGSMLISRTTIWRWLYEAGITLERFSSITDDDLDSQVGMLQMCHPHCGHILLCSMLEAQGINVPQHRLRESIHRIDLKHSSSRWHQKIRRRTYYVPGPNSLWHIDSHHSLICWHVVVHGCIDGYSRMILF